MKLKFLTFLPGLILFCLLGRAAAGDKGTAGWNRESAAKYLDDRMELWFKKAKKLRTGQTETSCVSCHTTIPYMLARPALRSAMQVSTTTPLENRILTEIKQRVETYAEHEPLYDFDEPKKIQSRGTEAVLNALILACADGTLGSRPGKIDGTTKLALKRLWQTQRPDGGWDWLDFGLEPFESVDGAYFGTTLAALAVGMTQDSTASIGTSAPGAAAIPANETNVGIDKLRKYLRDKYPSQSLFNRTWLLLASTRIKDLLTEEQRQLLIKEIESRQHDDGGWALESLGPWRWSKTAGSFQPPGKIDSSLLSKSDGYATGLIVYTLRRAGLPADRPVVSRGLQRLKANLTPRPPSLTGKGERDLVGWAPWRAYSLNYDREHGGDKGESWRRMFMSDLATGFTVLALVGSE